MSRVMALSFVRLIVALIILECFLAAWVPPRVTASSKINIAPKSFAAVLWSSLLAGPEEEKVEEKEAKAFSVEISDLALNIFFLSQIHTAPRQHVVCTVRDDHQALLFVLFCSLII